MQTVAARDDAMIAAWRWNRRLVASDACGSSVDDPVNHGQGRDVEKTPLWLAVPFSAAGRGDGRRDRRWKS